MFLNRLVNAELYACSWAKPPKDEVPLWFKALADKIQWVDSFKWTFKHVYTLELVSAWSKTLDTTDMVSSGTENCCYEDTNFAWWRHQIETFSALLSLCGGIHRWPVKSPHKGQWRGALMFSLICDWINGWVNNREDRDLRRHHAHYGVIVMVATVGVITAFRFLCVCNNQLCRLLLQQHVTTQVLTKDAT